MSQRPKVTVGGVRQVVEVWGEPQSPKMVLLHALAERGRTWSVVADRLGESYELFAPDLRGHGDSERTGSYSFGAMFDDVTGLLDELGLTSVVLVGHSMGGVVAYLVAQHRPDLVDGLIIEDVAPAYKRDRPLPERPADSETFDFDWDVVPAIITEVNAGAPEMWEALPTITAPTLIIGGGPDSHIPQDQLQDVARRLPQGEIQTIPAGHHVHTGEPQQFADIVLGWLRDVDDLGTSAPGARSYERP